MDDPVRVLAFFDIGGTLANVTVGPGGDRITALEVLPEVPEVLDRLRAGGVRLGIISNPGSIPPDEVKRALADAGIPFDPDLVIFGPKDSPAIFRLAATTHAHPGERLMFVGEDPAERAHAAEAGFMVRSRPSLALDVLE